MILCLYHGSTYKGVNEQQTSTITTHVADQFADRVVVPCYYSQQVLVAMERRNQRLLSLSEALAAEYDQHRLIYVLITNMIDGYEYQQILKTIDAIDVEHKVFLTDYLLSAKNVYNLADCIINKSNPTLFIGHRHPDRNTDYERLNELLIDDGNVVTTLGSDLAPVMNKYFISKRLIVRPLMLTSGYHLKVDIEQNIIGELKQLGYKPIIDLRPLCHNSRIIELLINNLRELIAETES